MKDITISNEKFKQLINTVSIISARTALASQMGQQYGGDRDVNKTLGYLNEPTFETYWSYYKRHDIAKTIIKKPVQTTWRRRPEITDAEKSDKKSPLIKAWDELVKRIRVFHYMERADRLSGIGRFGGLVIGVAGGADLSQPVERVSGASAILGLTAHSEGTLVVKTLDSRVMSPRFQLPEMYQINIPTSDQSNMNSRTIQVHWSRVIHFADGLEDSEIYGTPRLEPVLNRIFDLMKVVGGSAETYWRVADRGFHFNVDPEFDLKDEDITDLETQINEYIQDMRRYIFTQGVDVKQLGSDVVNPKEPFDVIMSCIAGVTGIPKRILMGSERGELSSTTDLENYFGMISERQTNYIEPYILDEFITRLQGWGALPAGEYETIWPSLYEDDPKDKSETVLNIARAMKEFAEAKALGAPIAVDEFREMIDLPAEWEGPSEEELARFLSMEDLERVKDVENWLKLTYPNKHIHNMSDLADYEYLLHHIEIDDDGSEIIHHCLIYDHIANMFEQEHLVIKNGKSYLNDKLIKDNKVFHIINGLESTQEVVWSDEEAKENNIIPKKMRSGMTLKQKSKEW